MEKRFYTEPFFYIYSNRIHNGSVECEKIGKNCSLLRIQYLSDLVSCIVCAGGAGGVCTFLHCGGGIHGADCM